MELDVDGPAGMSPNPKSFKSKPGCAVVDPPAPLLLLLLVAVVRSFHWSSLEDKLGSTAWSVIFWGH